MRAHTSRAARSTTRRALILGSVIWLAKQMKLIEFMTAADELFYERQIEPWVVGNVPDYLQAKNHLCATRFLGFVEDLEPIFRSVRIWYRRRADRRRVQAQNAPLYFQSSAYCPR
jgi:hypothetical protein